MRDHATVRRIDMGVAAVRSLDRRTESPDHRCFVRFTWPKEDCDGDPDNCCWFLVD